MARVSRAQFLRGILFGALCAAWPTASLIGARLPQPSVIGALIAFTPSLLMLGWMAWQSAQRLTLLALLAPLMALLWGQRAWLMQHYGMAYLTEHAGMMTFLAWVFGRTLQQGRTPLVTRFALLAHESVSPRILRYTRGVTLAWTLFFGLMASSSLLLFIALPLSRWALFANVASPLLLLGMFAAEYLVRLRAIPADERVGPVEAFRAYMRYNRERRGTAGASDSPPWSIARQR